MVSNDTACGPEWLSKLAYRVRRAPDIAQRLIVEITESHAAESMEEVRRFIENVKDLGCRVAFDEFSREWMAIHIKRKLNSTDVIDARTDLFILYGVPGCIRCDNVVYSE